MTENNKFERKTDTRVYVELVKYNEEVRNIGTIVRRNSIMEAVKRIIDEVYAVKKSPMTIVFDSPDDAFFASGAPSGKSSFFSSREICARCMKVEKPRTVSFARYMNRFGNFYTPYNGGKALEDTALSVAGFVPTALSKSHPELYGNGVARADMV